MPHTHLVNETAPAPSSTDLDDEQLLVLLEGLLFVASEPAAIERLATALDVSISRIEQGLQELETQLLHRGIRLQRHNGSARALKRWRR